MKKLILSAMLLFAISLTVSAQKVEIEVDTAEKCAKCFTESPLKDKVIESQTAEITALKNEMRATENLVAAKNQIIDLQMKQIEIYRAIKCSKFSILFGIISKKTCY